MLGLSNYKTNVMGRVDSDTRTPKAKIDRLIELAEKTISNNRKYVWNANINGVIIELITNNEHLMDFWIDNWFPAPLEGIQPHGRIFAAVGVEGEPTFSYYNSESKTAVFINTDYYGQCKSWALGIVADIMEVQHNIHSIHGAVVDIGGSGIVIIAPTGTGKSTHSYGMVLNVPNARIHSDDWCYVDYIGGERGRASATISERKFYLRTDIADNYPQLKEVFNICKLENVGEAYSSINNSRAMMDPTWIGGTEKFIYTTRLRSVVLLRRDDSSPPEVRLNPREAIDILQKGAYMVLPGAGPKEQWGQIKYEPFYNPYLLVRTRQREKLQIEFFRKLFAFASCHILNTGVESIEQTQQRILRIAREAAEKLMKE